PLQEDRALRSCGQLDLFKDGVHGGAAGDHPAELQLTRWILAAPRAAPRALLQREGDEAAKLVGVYGLGKIIRRPRFECIDGRAQGGMSRYDDGRSLGLALAGAPYQVDPALARKDEVGDDERIRKA